ncbi:N-acetylmuramoyl-L-alanine amidase [Methylobacter tundripaludum]|uniref:N-acetylmuramoyl-L-alanine amidase AmiC n=1 Tax=Methylobacter tundripaludum TaxID=173365 RepID=A0A2S6GSX5_9GAMM|nr:N-acetylmuramoyl-L-alanine amidase [Methylobacter tundripaludum]PPK68221.1 N-acetylmuramoyl-L-alanine amidase [Methylobacter tundripaludum]
MGSYWKLLFVIGLQVLAVVPGYAQQIDVSSLRYWNTPDQTQMLFDVTASPEHRIFLMKNPARLVIDMRNVNLKQALSQPPASHPLFSQVRVAAKNKTDIRIVVDLKREISAQSTSLRTNSLNGKRLVIELLDKNPNSYAKLEQKADIKPIASKPAALKAADSQQQIEKPVKELQKKAAEKSEAIAVKSTKEAEKAEVVPVKSTKTAKRNKDIIIAVDAGHGGNDPGAHGANGTEEKKITLEIARKLAHLINKQPGMKAVMVRKGDYFVDLRKRMQIARAAKADLFISIHADAFQNTTVKGASVFTLSNKGATSEAARWLADSENASDLVGGVSLNDKEDVLASVLLDLSQTATQDASVNVAGKVLKNFERIGELHYASVQKAGFLVLKSPDVPSILVETAFISNPSEELRLVNAAHQAKIAGAIFDGVRNYFDTTSPYKPSPEGSSVAALEM